MTKDLENGRALLKAAGLKGIEKIKNLQIDDAQQLQVFSGALEHGCAMET